MMGKAYTCSDCGERVSTTEIVRSTESERAALRDGDYLCVTCRQQRQLTSP